MRRTETVDPRTFIFFVFLFTGMLLVAMSLPLVLNLVPPNPWYGLLTPRTTTDVHSPPNDLPSSHSFRKIRCFSKYLRIR